MFYLNKAPLLGIGMQPCSLGSGEVTHADIHGKSQGPVTGAGTVLQSLPLTGYQVQITVCTTLSPGLVGVASVVLSVSIGQGQKGTRKLIRMMLSQAAPWWSLAA